MRLDLHTHTFFSDSLYSPESVVQAAIDKKVGGIAITDHNEFRGAERAEKYARDKGLWVIKGEEIMTDKGEVIGLFLSKKIERGPFSLVIDNIRAQGGLVVFPHPCDRLRKGILKKEPSLAVIADAIEVFNARVIFRDDNREARAMAEKVGKAVVGGSDAHFAFEVGSGWTEFDGKGEEDFREAIRNCTTKAGGKYSSLFVHGFGKVAGIVNRGRR